MNAKEQAVYPAEQTGLPDDVEVDDVATDGSLTWFATGTGMLEFDGSHWRKLPPPSARVSGANWPAQVSSIG